MRFFKRNDKPSDSLNETPSELMKSSDEEKWDLLFASIKNDNPEKRYYKIVSSDDEDYLIQMEKLAKFVNKFIDSITDQWVQLDTMNLTLNDNLTFEIEKNGSKLQVVLRYPQNAVLLIKKTLECLISPFLPGETNIVYEGNKSGKKPSVKRDFETAIVDLIENEFEYLSKLDDYRDESIAYTKNDGVNHHEWLIRN
ncbi:hypothetical protein [Parasitella parasitica]|uniref:Uncharacterized protein n=1 Tax=Parasitella parasitica TaxID=35722 RepID=A0A0B7MZJ5_9FUNG|nr:hypothetical protein [Parasitella parasitica]